MNYRTSYNPTRIVIGATAPREPCFWRGRVFPPHLAPVPTTTKPIALATLCLVTVTLGKFTF